jgi:hypothetical protein
MGFGGDLMLKKHFGVGMDVSFQPGKETYVPNLSVLAAADGYNTFAIQNRMILFGFNGIYQPISTKKVQLKLQGGIGGADLRFYENVSSSSGLGSSNQSAPVPISGDHFQVHGGVGVDIFVTDHIYIRPQFDVHYIPGGMTAEGRGLFGSSAVLTGMVWVGYSWGDR